MLILVEGCSARIICIENAFFSLPLLSSFLPSSAPFHLSCQVWQAQCNAPLCAPWAQVLFVLQGNKVLEFTCESGASW